jgi:hypothetical protein
VVEAVGREVGNIRVDLGEDRLQASPARKRIVAESIQVFVCGCGGIM